jgi:Rrf2 family protein
MKISAQEEYGLRCLLCLARRTDQSATLPEIAAAEGLNTANVAKLMATLRQAGLVESARGCRGGYRLALPADDIGLGSLLLVLGDPLFDEVNYCHKHAGNAPDGICVHHGTCTLKALWQTLEAWMRRTLDQITLADLLQTETNIVDVLRERLTHDMLEDHPALIQLTTPPRDLGLKPAAEHEVKETV